MVKTVGVSSARHLKNVCAYLNDERVVAREGWNLGDPRVGRWEREMERSRVAYGHDVAAKAGAKNTILYHQILAFNADDCRLNGRKEGLSGSDCMNYAREWCVREYPNQEVLLVLHKEHCAADNTDRWAVHLAVNRSDLVSGKRYHAGPGQVAAAHRAKLARELDKEWGLKETVRGERNSEVHRRQPSRTVKEIRARSEQPVFDFVRNAVSRALEPSAMRSLVQLKNELAKSGIALAQKANELYYKAQGYVFKGETIGFSKADVQAVLNEREQVARRHHAASELRRTHEFTALVAQKARMEAEQKREEDKPIIKPVTMPERRAKQHESRHDARPMKDRLAATIASSQKREELRHGRKHQPEPATVKADINKAVDRWVLAFSKCDDAWYTLEQARASVWEARDRAYEAEEELAKLSDARYERNKRLLDEEPNRWNFKEHRQWQTLVDEATREVALAEQHIKENYGSEEQAERLVKEGLSVDIDREIGISQAAERELARAERDLAHAACEHGWSKDDVRALADKVNFFYGCSESLSKVVDHMEQREYSDGLLQKINEEHAAPVHKSHEDALREIQERRAEKAAASRAHDAGTQKGLAGLADNALDALIAEGRANAKAPTRESLRRGQKQQDTQEQSEIGESEKGKGKGGRDDR